MFKKKIALSLMIILPIFGFWLYRITALTKKDLDLYSQMIANREIATSKLSSPTNQHRKNVRKDVWISQDDNFRLHYQISSVGSLLTLTPINNKFEVVETLSDIKCWMQDKLFTEADTLMQQIRYIEADSGHYLYNSQEFTAKNVTLSLYRLPGSALPKQPIEDQKAVLQGIAKDITLLFDGKTPQFQAKHFQATMRKNR